MNLLQHLAIWDATPGALPILLHGAPATAKTSRVAQYAQARDAHLEVFIASIHEPSDLVGLPIPDGCGGMHFAPPTWALRLRDRGGYLFLDEINTAPPLMQPPLLRLTLEGMAGDIHINAKIIAACNPVSQAASGWELPPPLANRFYHLRVTLELSDWLDWLAGAPTTATLPTVDPTTWASSYAQARGTIAGFLRARPGALFEAPEIILGSDFPAYATPRTWECAARLRATAHALQATDEAHAMILEGTIGARIMPELIHYAAALDLPDPELLLRDPSAFKVDPKRPDRTYAILTAVVAATPPTPPDEKLHAERWAAAWRVLGRAIKAHRDLVYIACKPLVKSRPNAPLTPEVVEVVGDLRELNDLLHTTEGSARGERLK